MCRRINCSKCSKPTFAGCGAHIEQVLAGVPVADRCQGHKKEVAADGDASKPGWFGSLFGKR